MLWFFKVAGISGILSGGLVALIYLYPDRAFLFPSSDKLVSIAVLLSVVLYVGLGLIMKSLRMWIPTSIAIAVSVKWFSVLGFSLQFPDFVRGQTWPIQLLILFLSLSLMSATFLARGWKLTGFAGTLVGMFAAAVIFEELLLFNNIIRSTPLGNFVFPYLGGPHILGSAAWRMIMGVAALRVGLNSSHHEANSRLALDFYKRKLPSKSAQVAVPVASTKTAGFGGELKELLVIQTVAKHDDSCCGGSGGSCGCSN